MSQWFDTNRQHIKRALQTSDTPILLASGFYPRAGAPDAVKLRSVYIGSTPGKSTDKAGSTLTFRLSGGRSGVTYHREFNLAVGQEAMFNAENLESLSIYLVAYAGIDDVTIETCGGGHPPVSTSIHPLLWLDEVPSTAPAEIKPVPAGAQRVTAFTTAPDFRWVIYDGAGTPIELATPLAPGSTSPVQGTHYRGSPSAKLVWEVVP